MSLFSVSQDAKNKISKYLKGNSESDVYKFGKDDIEEIHNACAYFGLLNSETSGYDERENAVYGFLPAFRNFVNKLSSENKNELASYTKKLEKQIENIEDTENNLVLVIYSSMQEEEFGNKYNYYGELIQRDFKAKRSFVYIFIATIAHLLN